MSLKLEDVKGLGKKAEDLRKVGIDSVEKLANTKVDDLLKIKGIGKASADKFITSAKELISGGSIEPKKLSESAALAEEDKKGKEELKRLEEKRKKLEGKKVENDDFVLVKITGKTQRGTIFRVSSEEDAKKAGIYDDQKAKQGYYTPEFVIVGKPGFLNEGLTETLQDMNYFEKKSVRVPPSKAFGRRDPQKIERIGIAKFRKLNDGKNPEIGQEFIKKGTGQRGVVTNILQGRVIVDYNHPLAGQSIDYNLEVVEKIEEFDEKIEYFMISKGIPKENVKDFKINYNKDNKLLEITIPKMFLFQNLTYIKFGLALDLQTHMSDEINDVKFIEIYEKMPIPESPADSVNQKVEEFNIEQEENTGKEKNKN
ncbi:MAG: helix-hairpin-helix domain-containing protein [Promethearchaeota archaeon]